MCGRFIPYRSGERSTTDVIVAATGWRTRRFLEGVFEIPLRPYRTQVFVLEPESVDPAAGGREAVDGEEVTSSSGFLCS